MYSTEQNETNFWRDIMKALKTNWKSFWGLLFAGFFFCSLTCPSNAQQRDYKEVEIYMTAKDTPYRLTSRGFRAFEPRSQPDENYPTIMIDISKTFQTIEGFGGGVGQSPQQQNFGLDFCLKIC